MAKTESEWADRQIREQKAGRRIGEQIFLDERGHGERLIRAMLPFNQASEYRPHTFLRADVQSVAGVEPDASAIILRSGIEIPVALPYRELEQKVFRPNFKVDDPVLDLCEVTGTGAKPQAPFQSPRSRP